MSSPLWALTCLFNPLGVRRRAANYRIFRRHLGVPVATVELAFNGTFELSGGDADILVKVTGGDVMWQKERLLNIGLAHLPADCTAVAVLDCDVVFANPAWPRAALRMLREKLAVQLFSAAFFLERDVTPGPAAKAHSETRPTSAAKAISDGVSPEACFDDLSHDGRGRSVSGMAWAFRRDLLVRHGLFDACIIGGGDTAAASAAFGSIEAVERRHSMNVAQRQYYRAWASSWFESVAGRVGALEGDLYHLWHGDMIHRRAAARHGDLAVCGFDPSNDIRAAEDRPWRWSSRKPLLHGLLTDYFAGRREDG
jgi:hypothetical protein